MKKKLITLSGFVLGFAPFMVLAQQSGQSLGCDAAELGTIQKVICIAGNILDTLIPILVVLGVVYFVWGVVQYVISSEEEAKQKGKMRMIYGIIGLVVTVAMWGLVGIVKKTFDLDQPTNISIPTVPF